MALLSGLMLAASPLISARSQESRPKSQEQGSKKAMPAIEPKADRILRQMSDYLRKLPAGSVSTSHSIDVVLDSGQKLTFDGESEVDFQRPNKLRSDRKGEIAHLSFYYDGRQIALYGRKLNYYAITTAPPTLDGAIDYAREQLYIEAPAADFLTSDPYKVLTEDTVSGLYVGRTVINGVDSHHLAFRGRETDWQIWIADGAKPLPTKLQIVSKKMAQAPEFEVELKDWNTTAKFPANHFTFTPPKGAMRIAFANIIKEDERRTR